MRFEIPIAMKAEHNELHEALVHATKAGGQTGEAAKAAKAVAKVLHAHFVKEEEYALPPLGYDVAGRSDKFHNLSLRESRLDKC
jgi:hypothetical protein